MTNFKKSQLVCNLEVGSQILIDHHIDKFNVWRIYKRYGLVTKTIDSEFCVDLITKANWWYYDNAINLR